METVHQCLGTAEMNTWLKARKAAGRVAGMHIRMYRPSFFVDQRFSGLGTQFWNGIKKRGN